MENRREFLRKAAYCTPILLSLPVRPSFAGTTYGNPGGGGGGGGGGGSTPPQRNRGGGGSAPWWEFWRSL